MTEGSDREAAHVEMDAAQIVATIFDRHGERFGLTTYSRRPPNADVDPIVVDEIHADPPGGRKDLPKALIWCSECEQPKFWDGLAITDGTGGLFLIGETCGARFYGGDRLQSARRSWRTARDHERALSRFVAAKAAAPAALNAIKAARATSGIAILDEARRVLRLFCSELVLRLRSNLVAHNGIATIQETVTDTQGKTFVAKRGVGRVAGVALLRDLWIEQKAIDALEAAAYPILALKEPEKAKRTDLTALVTAFYDTAANLDHIWAEARVAHHFFGEKNLARVKAFADVMCPTVRLQVIDNGLASGAREFGAFDQLDLPRLALPTERLT